MTYRLIFILLVIGCCACNSNTQHDDQDNDSLPNSTASLEHEEKKHADPMEKIYGSWKTEGNQGVVPSWLVFDAASQEYYQFTDEEGIPESANGAFLMPSDSVIELTDFESNRPERLLIDSVSENYLKLIPLGPSAGDLVYKRTNYNKK